MPVKNEIACYLCGLDCGRDPLTQDFDGTEYAFCCAGCMNVYAILLESGVVEEGVEVTCSMFADDLAQHDAGILREIGQRLFKSNLK